MTFTLTRALWCLPAFLSWIKPTIEGYNNLFNLINIDTEHWHSSETSPPRPGSELSLGCQKKNGNIGTGPSKNVSMKVVSMLQTSSGSHQLCVTPCERLYRRLCWLRCRNKGSNQPVHQNSKWNICSSPTRNQKTKTWWNSQRISSIN